MTELVAQLRSLSVPAFVREVAHDFASHQLIVFTSAVAFRTLVALVPLTLLGLGLLGVLGLEDVWHDSIAPPLAERLTAPVYAGIDYSVEEILRTGSAGLLAAASALLLWDMLWAVEGVRKALNALHETDESRPLVTRLTTSLGLAFAVSALVIGAVLVVIVAPLGAEDGFLHWVLGVFRWPVAVFLLGLAIGLLIHYAPAERPDVRWVSVGTVLVVGAWILASLGFRFWVTNVADYKSATGTLTAFLVLTGYVFTSVGIFLAGAQLDETLRTHSRRSS